MLTSGFLTQTKASVWIRFGVLFLDVLARIRGLLFLTIHFSAWIFCAASIYLKKTDKSWKKWKIFFFFAGVSTHLLSSCPLHNTF